MNWFVCNDCGNVFDESHARRRPAQLEDSIEPWDTVLQCPICHSEDLADAEICPLCGKAHIPTESGYCDGCWNYVEADLKKVAWARGEGDDAEEALKDLICKIYGL